MKKKFFTVLFFLLFSTKIFSAEKLTVMLDWFINPDHAPLFIAKEHGFFANQNLDVELIGPADPTDPTKLVAAGKADIAITYQPEFLEEVDQGLPLKFIGNLIDKPLGCLVTLKNSNIHSISQLKNKSIGYSGGGKNHAILKIMLEKNGLTFNDVNLINIHYDLTQALLSKNIDAVTGMMRNFEITQMNLTGNPAVVFYPERNGVPTYSELIFVAKNNNDPRFKLFLKAIENSISYLKLHPQEGWGEFSKAYPELNNELNKRAWFDTISLFANHPDKVDKNLFFKFASFMKNNGLIQEIKPTNQYF